MELKTYGAILARRGWIIVSTVILTLAVTVVSTLLLTPRYQATTTLRIATATSGSVEWLNYDTGYADRLMNTYRELVTTYLERSVVERLELSTPPAVEATILANTELLQITARHPDPNTAAEVANALATTLVERNGELNPPSREEVTTYLSQQLVQAAVGVAQAEQRYAELSRAASPDLATATQDLESKRDVLATLTQQYEQSRTLASLQTSALSVVNLAEVPQTPSWPNRTLNLALGLGAGLLGGLGLAFLFENLDTTLYTTGQIEEATGGVVLSRIPLLRAGRRAAKDPFDEAFRRLRTNLLVECTPPAALAVTSAAPGEGASTVALNLAAALSRAGQRVLLMDGNFRQPSLHTMLNLSDEGGLSDVLGGHAVGDLVQRSRFPNVQVLTTGPVTQTSFERLGSPRLNELLEELKAQYDWILLDTPALLTVADALTVAPKLDGVLLVVSRARSKEDAVRAARQQLAAAQATLLGVVENRA